METLRCSFCGHGNPVAAKFCNACGSSLDLQLCQHCSAIDSASSRSCYKCGTPFGFVWADGDSPPSSAGKTPETSPDAGGPERGGARRPGVLHASGLALLAVAAIFAFQLFVAGQTPPAIKRNIVDATLGAVPPRAAASFEPAPIVVSTDVQAVAPVSATLAMPEPVAIPARADGVPPYPCSAEVDALGLCN